jgi:hypothetical protein
LNRYEVTVLFRVSPISKVGSYWVTSSRYGLGTSPAPDLAGISPAVRTQGRDPLCLPLLRFDPPLRFISETFAANLSASNNSPGISSPYSAQQRKSTSLCCQKASSTEPKVQSRYPPAAPTLLATVPLSGFLNLSATLLLPLASHRFQVGDTLGVMPFRGLVPSRSLPQLITVRMPS